MWQRCDKFDRADGADLRFDMTKGAPGAAGLETEKMLRCVCIKHATVVTGSWNVTFN